LAGSLLAVAASSAIAEEDFNPDCQSGNAAQSVINDPNCSRLEEVPSRPGQMYAMSQWRQCGQRKELEEFVVTDVVRAIRRVPGVSQIEDGFGLRPNISIRGTATERSRITPMEDGVLLRPLLMLRLRLHYFPLWSCIRWKYRGLASPRGHTPWVRQNESDPHRYLMPEAGVVQAGSWLDTWWVHVLRRQRRKGQFPVETTNGNPTAIRPLTVAIRYRFG
jgi:hypothetical protein